MKLSRGGVFRAMACASAVAGMVVLASSAASATDGGGTSVASASLVRPGVPEYGNTASGSVAQPSNAQCNSNIQFWKIPLLAGDQVTVTGRAISPASNINVWFYPPGTTDASFSSGNFPNPDWSGSTNGGPTAGGTLGQSIVFTVPATGVYPVLIGQCGGQDGPYEFEVSVKHAAVLYSRSLLRTGVTGDLIAYVRTPGGHPISDPSLVVTLYGFWRDNSVLPVSKHVVAKAHVSGGVVKLPFHLPAATVHKAVTFVLVAAGPDYLPSNHLNVKDIVS